MFSTHLEMLIPRKLSPKWNFIFLLTLLKTFAGLGPQSEIRQRSSNASMGSSDCVQFIVTTKPPVEILQPNLPQWIVWSTYWQVVFGKRVRVGFKLVIMCCEFSGLRPSFNVILVGFLPNRLCLVCLPLCHSHRAPQIKLKCAYRQYSSCQ